MGSLSHAERYAQEPSLLAERKFVEPLGPEPLACFRGREALGLIGGASLHSPPRPPRMSPSRERRFFGLP